MFIKQYTSHRLLFIYIQISILSQICTNNTILDFRFIKLMFFCQWDSNTCVCDIVAWPAPCPAPKNYTYMYWFIILQIVHIVLYVFFFICKHNFMIQKQSFWYKETVNIYKLIKQQTISIYVSIWIWQRCVLSCCVILLVP